MSARYQVDEVPLADGVTLLKVVSIEQALAERGCPYFGGACCSSTQKQCLIGGMIVDDKDGLMGRGCVYNEVRP